MRTAGCCPCWCACASCLCPSSCSAMCPSVPGCPPSSGRMPISSPLCCSSPFPTATWCLSPCAWHPGLGSKGLGAGGGETGFCKGRPSPQVAVFRPLVSSYRTGLHCGTCPKLRSGNVTCLGGPAIFSRGGRAGTLRQVSMSGRTNRDIFLRISDGI